jgi:cobaltochelatase CobN
MCLKNKFFLLLALFFISHLAFAKNVTVSLLLGDTDSRATVMAVKSLQKQPEMKEVNFQVYLKNTLDDKQHQALQQSQLVFVQIMGSQLFNAVQDDLKAVIQTSGKVYALYPESSKLSEDKKAIGLVDDETALTYHRAGGQENLTNLLRYVLNKEGLIAASAIETPKPLPEVGIYHVGDEKIYTDFASYEKACADCLANKPFVGIHFGRANLTAGQMATVQALAGELKKRGYNALPVFGYPPETALQQFFLTPDGKSRVEAIIGLTLKIGVTPATNAVFEKLNVPILNAIVLSSQTEKEWQNSNVGLDVTERSWQIAGAELGGLIAPTVVASKEHLTDKETGLSYLEEHPIAERVQRAANRIDEWVKLRTIANHDKKLAILYYNYPPGKENIGASYLNVLPESLWQLVERLKREGYNLENAPQTKEALFQDIKNFGTNINKPDKTALNTLVKSGHAALFPVSEYQKLFAKFPESLRSKMVKDWGEPEKSEIMVWRDEKNVPFFVFPQIRYGNVVFTPQPTRGWEQDVKKLYHDVTVAPHHQYVALYLWLQHQFAADAVTHVGTHGSLEWLSGKEVGASESDPSDLLIGAMPHLYLYIMDDVGEALQAKRRSMAVIIDHLTPPFDKAGMQGELKELAGRINDYNVAKDKSATAAANQLVQLNQKAEEIGILKDLNLTKIENDEQIELVEHYIKEIAEKAAPFGLHTFGVAPTQELRQKTAEAILSLDKSLSDSQRKQKISELDKTILDSANAELDAFIAGLSGRYIKAGVGADPLRNPDALPTGRDVYGFDPSRMPSPTSYAQGEKLALELIENYKKEHGQYPDKLTFNLWGVESSRHEGVMESQIFHLLGVKPVWDARGRISGVTAIPRDQLKHPRIDVTIVPSGLYRDLFGNLIKLLDDAVTLAKQQDEPDNFLRQHVAQTKAELIKQGVNAEQAEKLATVRLFTVPSGAYGTNLEKAIPLSNTWKDDKQLADIYFMRMSHLYGQGFWGDKSDEKVPQLAVNLLKQALSGSKMVVHSRSSNVYATLDGNDFLQYMGGTAMAIRAVDGKSPETYVTNLSDPANAKQETLAKYMGREMRSRYLNPEWIKAMMKEGYSGARFVNMVVENLWGWQVTVPEVVDGAKWQEMYETYVEDKNQLDIKDKFREANNLLAYQAMVDRMLVAVKKGYWKADAKTVERLEKENAEVIKEVGVACTADSCSDAKLAQMQPAPTPTKKAATAEVMPPENSPPPAPQAQQNPKPAANASQAVKGYEMQEKKMTSQSPQNNKVDFSNLLLILLFVSIYAYGFLKPQNRF